MKKCGRLTISHGFAPSRLERLRSMDQRHREFVSDLLAAERIWSAGADTADNRRDACTLVLGHLVGFAVDAGVPPYAVARLNDLMVALGELTHGRHSALLAPAKVHAGGFAAVDLAHQAFAQVCVDLIREAGTAAGKARTKVASLLSKYGIPKFSQAKLRHLQSRLCGPGCSQDEAYGMYVWVKGVAETEMLRLGLQRPLDQSGAFRLADVLVNVARKQDHRRDFFFAPREESNALP